MTIWQKGLPSKDGVYWFDNGLRHLSFTPTDAGILQVRKGDLCYFGDYGSMELNSYFPEKLLKRARFAEIDPPTKWLSIEATLKSKEWKDYRNAQGKRRAWVSKTPLGPSLGIGLLDSWSESITGTIVWISHDNSVSESGVWIRPEYDRHVFSLIPIVSIET